MTYKGRFAPSPTGPLHLGSLVAALGSYLDARTNDGVWLVRMEDIDPPREVSGAKVSIPSQLETHGLYWDEEITYQSERTEIYRHFLGHLKTKRTTYSCTCSRQRIKNLGGNYDGLCRPKNEQAQEATNEQIFSAIRIRLDDTKSWNDLVLGQQVFTPKELHGDFIVKRRDDLFSYQLAVAIDDALQEITHVIRGADLLDSTARQIHIQQLSDLKSPAYGHLPVVVNNSGQKLSKQNLAASLDETKPAENLITALELLGQDPDQVLKGASIEEIISWGKANWNLSKVPTKPVTFNSSPDP